MFDNWTIKETVKNLGLVLLIILVLQVYLFLTVNSGLLHFGFSFIALFVALILFHTVNIKLKQKDRKK